VKLRRASLALLTLSVAAGESPPREFRIFAAGPNASRKGTVVFDDEAARAVMASYQQHGTDIMLDLEHLSLDDDNRNFDPDARGWCRLEVRGGELWAVDVRWTPDGETRLREKRQRYISPAFTVDPASKRVRELVNIAITAMPATDKLTPLVAARARAANQERDSAMKINPKLLAALGLPDDADEDTVKAAVAEAMKDAAKMMALLSAMGDADDASDAGGDAGASSEGDGEAAAAKRSDAPGGDGDAGQKDGGQKPALKKVTTEYRGARARQTTVGDDLAAEVLELRARVNGNEVRELLAANRQKLTPALERWATEKFATDSKGLTDWLRVQPVLADSTRHTEKRHAAKDAVALTRADLEMCRQLGRDPAAFLKHKRELAAKNDPAALTALIDEES
jgi:phage I-like protein